MRFDGEHGHDEMNAAGVEQSLAVEDAMKRLNDGDDACSSFPKMWKKQNLTVSRKL